MNNKNQAIGLRELKKQAEKIGIITQGMGRGSILKEMEKKTSGNSSAKVFKEGEVLGIKGKDGSVTEVTVRRKTYAKKQFRTNRPIKEILREVKLQSLGAAARISPKIREYNLNSKYILMDKLETNLFCILRKKNGKLTKNLQKEILRLFRILDRIGVFHKDPNPLNFMLDENKQLYIIDYGFAEHINEKKHGKSPNINQMTLGFLIKMKKLFPEGKYDVLRNSLAPRLLEILEMQTRS